MVDRISCSTIEATGTLSNLGSTSRFLRNTRKPFVSFVERSSMGVAPFRNGMSSVPMLRVEIEADRTAVHFCQSLDEEGGRIHDEESGG